MTFYKKESSTLELKETNSPSFLKTVSAYANFQDGKIVFGVTDKTRQVIGVSQVDEMKLSIENAINDNIKPIPTFKLYEAIYEGEPVVILKVYKGEDTPYLYKNKAYRRQDTSSIAVDKVTMNRLILEGSNLTYEELKSKEKKLEFKLLGSSLKDKIELEHFDDDTLRTLGLMSMDDYTNAGNLFSDSPTYPFGIDVVRFGESDSIFLGRVELIGISILEQYNQALKVFDEWYGPYEEVVGFYREKRVRVPRESYREALANAIIHRDYLLPGNIKIGMYQDKIEIISPGGFLAGIPLEVFETREISLQRNRNIADVFRRLGIVEKYGTGFKRMIRAYQEFRQRPIFSEEDDAIVSVILPVVSYAKDSVSDTPDYSYQVLLYIQAQVEVSKSQIQTSLGGSSSTLKRILNNLVEDRKIERIGKGRGTKYRIFS
jgi:ATP-dependent DNA helicase RecG